MLELLLAASNRDFDRIACVADAAERAREIVNDFVALEVEEIAHRFSAMQYEFERILGERYFGKKMYPYVFLAVLYSDENGFGDNKYLAQKIIHAFKHSTCSIEVKSYASDAAALFYLDFDDFEG